MVLKNLFKGSSGETEQTCGHAKRGGEGGM